MEDGGVGEGVEEMRWGTEDEGGKRSKEKI